MGISSLWKLLAEEGILRKLVGSSPEEHSSLLAELDGKVIAIDLSAWIMQADQQMALSPHFSRTERCMKVALERSIQWLRHGCLPVIVVEGTPPAEKQATIQARFAARNGFEGGGRGSASFLALGRAVGVLLSQLGLPVFYAPGEAEAVCVALERAGAVHACASFDSDTLVYGARRVYHTLKLNVRGTPLHGLFPESLSSYFYLVGAGFKSQRLRGALLRAGEHPSGACHQQGRPGGSLRGGHAGWIRL